VTRLIRADITWFARRRFTLSGAILGTGSFADEVMPLTRQLTADLGLCGNGLNREHGV